jgi:hypothetical protein
MRSGNLLHSYLGSGGFQHFERNDWFFWALGDQSNTVPSDAGRESIGIMESGARILGFWGISTYDCRFGLRGILAFEVANRLAQIWAVLVVRDVTIIMIWQ